MCFQGVSLTDGILEEPIDHPAESAVLEGPGFNDVTIDHPADSAIVEGPEQGFVDVVDETNVERSADAPILEPAEEEFDAHVDDIDETNVERSAAPNLEGSYENLEQNLEDTIDHLANSAIVEGHEEGFDAHAVDLVETNVEHSAAPIPGSDEMVEGGNFQVPFHGFDVDDVDETIVERSNAPNLGTSNEEAAPHPAPHVVIDEEAAPHPAPHPAPHVVIDIPMAVEHDGNYFRVPAPAPMRRRTEHSLNFFVVCASISVIFVLVQTGQFEGVVGDVMDIFRIVFLRMLKFVFTVVQGKR